MSRKQVLETALTLTCGDRNVSYGKPSVNLECLGEMYGIYQKYSGKKHCKGHDAAMFQVLTKVSRVACGILKEDNYIDGAAYFAIAYECAEDSLEADNSELETLPSEENGVLGCPCDVCSCGSKKE